MRKIIKQNEVEIDNKEKEKYSQKEKRKWCRKRRRIRSRQKMKKKANARMEPRRKNEERIFVLIKQKNRTQQRVVLIFLPLVALKERMIDKRSRRELKSALLLETRNSIPKFSTLCIMCTCGAKTKNRWFSSRSCRVGGWANFTNSWRFWCHFRMKLRSALLWLRISF